MGIAVYLKDISKGVSNASALSQNAAHALMREVLEGRASAAESGAFVMAMRMKGAALDELAGFLSAAQEHCLRIHSAEPVVLIPSYSGSFSLPNLTPLLAMWLAREGVHVLLHGPMANASQVTSADILQDLGMAPALNTADVARAWARREPACMPTRVLCAPLQLLLDLKRLLGVRGPGHTVAKMLNPVIGAPALRLVSHSQAEMGAVMAAWARRDAVDAMLLPSTEGEPVADPRRHPRIDTWLAGQWRAELSSAANTGALSEMPLLPSGTTAAGTALYVQEVVSGMRPAPAPLARQAALILAAVAALRDRPATQTPVAA
jgi:anthranilate phosphoribosyltransferase